MEQFTDERGNTSRFEYDSFGRLTRDSAADGTIQALGRFDVAGGYRVTYSSGERRTTTYEVKTLEDGRVQRTVVGPDGIGSTSERTTTGTVRTFDASGTVTELTSSPDPRFGAGAGFASKSIVTTPLGRKFEVAKTRAIQLQDPTDPLSLTKFTEETTVAGTATTRVEFDKATRTWTMTSASGRKRDLIVDEKGRPKEVRVPGLSAVVYDYDAAGRLWRVTQGDRVSTAEFDASGRVESLTDAESRSVAFDYSAAHRVTSTVLPDASVIGFAYDASGNLTSLTPPEKTEHTFEYTAKGLESKYAAPAVGVVPRVTTRSYDKEWVLRREERPDGTAVQVARDPTSGRVTKVSAPVGEYTLAYEPGSGQLQSVTAPGGVRTNYGHEGPLLLAVDWSDGNGSLGSVYYEYDERWRTKTVSVNGANPITYQYDADGLLTAAGDLALTRNASNGFLEGSTLGDVTDTIERNAFGEPTRYTARHGAAVLLDVEYLGRDKLGRLTRKRETVSGSPAREWTYRYDVRGRLEYVYEVVGGVEQLVSQYGYDANGNRTTHTTPGGTTSGTYDAQDRLTSYGSATYTYGANGELATKTDGSGTTTYSYDAFGNLRRVELPNGAGGSDVIEYVIDGQNRRIGKVKNGLVVQRFLYDGQLRVIAELDGAGAVTKRFVYADGVNSPEYMVTAEGTFRIVKDHLGSPRLVVNVATGSVEQQLERDVFGVVVPGASPGVQPFGFAGGLYDGDTGLVRFGARDYDPVSGRWTSKDPLRFGGGDANLYSYVGSSPLNAVDPTGELALLPPDTVQWIGAAAWAAILFIEWDTGHGPNRRAFGPGHFATEDMRRSPGMATLRILYDQFKKANPQAASWTAPEGSHGPGPCAAAKHPIATFVATFEASAYDVGGGKTLWILKNPSGMTSFGHHTFDGENELPGWERRPYGGVPFGNIYQTFFWIE